MLGLRRGDRRRQSHNVLPDLLLDALEDALAREPIYAPGRLLLHRDEVAADLVDPLPARLHEPRELLGHAEVQLRVRLEAERGGARWERADVVGHAVRADRRARREPVHLAALLLLLARLRHALLLQLVVQRRDRLVERVAHVEVLLVAEPVAHDRCEPLFAQLVRHHHRAQLELSMAQSRGDRVIDGL